MGCSPVLKWIYIWDSRSFVWAFSCDVVIMCPGFVSSKSAITIAQPKRNYTLTDFSPLALLCLRTPPHPFSSCDFQRMMRQVWWIVCWKPYSRELHSETAGRERQDPEVSLISFTFTYAQTKDAHIKLISCNCLSVLIPVRYSKNIMTDLMLFFYFGQGWVNSMHPQALICLGSNSPSHLQNVLAGCLYTCLLAAQCQRIYSLTTLLQLFDVWISVHAQRCVCFL